MAESKKVSELIAQTQPPHTDDTFIIVDKDDATQSATSGSTKSITFGMLKDAIEEDGPQGNQGGGFGGNQGGNQQGGNKPPMAEPDFDFDDDIPF